MSVNKSCRGFGPFKASVPGAAAPRCPPPPAGGGREQGSWAGRAGLPRTSVLRGINRPVPRKARVTGVRVYCLQEAVRCGTGQQPVVTNLACWQG